MLAGKRRLGKTLLERHIVYDLIEDSRPIGFIEYSANRDRIEIRGQSYSIASEREPMTLLRAGGQAPDMALERYLRVEG
jgi:hypothetical protein